MANFLQILTPLLFSLALLLAAAITAESQATSFAHEFNGPKTTTLTYGGDAHFPSDTTYLRLTKTNASGVPQPKSVGRVVYSPVQFRSGGAQADFETTFKFIITPTAGSDPGDGLVFFIAPVDYEFPEGSYGDDFGVFAADEASLHVVAVEFDIIKGYSMDLRYPHVGIDIEILVSRNFTRVDDAIIGHEVTARISYVAATKKMTVNVAANSKTFEITDVFDLSTVLNEQVQVGISAATGTLVATHDVISWQFSSTIAGGNALGVV